MGLHQGSPLNPFLYVIVLDVLSESVRNKELRGLPYAADLAILADSPGARRKITTQQSGGMAGISIERKGLDVNAKKTEVI